MLHTHSRRFIENKEVDALYFALSLLSFAEGMISIFVPIFLWSLGFSLPWIIGYYLLDALYFVFFSSIFSRFFNRITDKTMIISGVPFLILYYGLLPLAKGFGLFVFLLPALLALHRLLFNVGYHADFSCASDDDGDLGDEVGTRNMFVSLMQFASPLLGGLLIAVSGYGLTFWIATGIVTVALVPLMFFSGHPMAVDAITNSSVYRLVMSKEYRNLVLASIGYSLEATAGSVFWPLYIFLIFSSTKTVGGIYSFISLLMALVSFLTGKFSNQNRYGRIVQYTVPLIALVWIVRVFLPGEMTILTSTPIKSILYAVMAVGWSGIFYITTKKAKPCGQLILASENIFNLTRVVGLSLFVILSILFSQTVFFGIMFMLVALLTLLMSRIAKQVA